jgi:hypothetical protein
MNAASSKWFVIAVFVALLTGPPIVQAIVEARRGDRPAVLAVFSRPPTPANLRAYETSLQDTSVTARALRPLMQAARFFLLGDAGEKAIVGRGGWLFYEPGVGFITQRPRPGDLTVEGALAAVKAFRDALDARGIRLIVMPAPNKESVYPDRLSASASAPAGPPIGAETRAFLAVCETAGIELVHLFAIDAEARRRADTPLYLGQDSHWTPEGLEIAARAVAARILDRGWLTPGAIRYDTRPARIQEHGDLVRMIRSPWIERYMPPEAIAAQQVVRCDDGALFRDDRSPEVLVLGDSFLRIFERDPPGGAGFVAHLARLTGRRVGSVISDGGASTLVRQALFRRPQLLTHCKVVVWEFVERDLRLGTEGWQIVPLPPAEGPSQSSRISE